MFLRKQKLRIQRSRLIRAWHRFRSLSGWRKSACINTILVSVVFLILLSCHIFLWTKSDSLLGYQIIHSGMCAGNGVGRLNTLLHLIINILSTLVLASTNFFMQVLNSPSREELDSAHENGSWLDIGVSSPRNAFRVARFKTIMWLLFLLTSIPIHLLFNSVIFSTDNRESEFSYFVFDESVLTGGAAFDPGTSLSIPYAYFGNTELYTYNYSIEAWTNTTTLNVARKWYLDTIHPNTSRVIHTTVDEILQGTWHKLDMSTCKSLYESRSCSGLRIYQDVALILGGSSGWMRSQVWDLPANESSFWDTYVPSDVKNSLWFAQVSEYSHDPCNMKPHSLPPDAVHIGTPICHNSCSIYMGLERSDPDYPTFNLFRKDPPQYSGPGLAPYQQLLSEETSGEAAIMVPYSPRSLFENSSLSIEYCLAKPLETTCHIGLASTLLLGVSICVLLKVLLCLIVITRLGKTTSLVTPGDAIESYISQPSEYIINSCLLSQRLLHSHGDSIEELLAVGPRKWKSSRYRRWHAIPRRIWRWSYFAFSVGIALLVYFFSSAYEMTGWAGYFGQDDQNETILFPGQFSPNLEQAILIVNFPQIFLSFSYLAFNNLFTRLQMAREWSAMSIQHKVLRVSDPKGQQSSTYFLQLPYRYSVPMLIISIMLHWIMSGCIYLFVMQGDYFQDRYTPVNGPFSSSLAVGFSTKSLLAMMTLAIILVLMPPLFGFIRLPANSIVVGSNSVAIAAACQISPLVGRCKPQPQPERYPTEISSHREHEEIELRHLMVSEPSLLSRTSEESGGWKNEEDRKATLLRVSQSKIRWGVVKMPSSWADQLIKREPTVEHISFGLPEDDVQHPLMGHWYA